MKGKYSVNDFVKDGRLHILETQHYVYEVRNYDKGKWRIDVRKSVGKSTFTYWYVRTLNEAKTAIVREANNIAAGRI
jgi:hypothetical protein